MCKLPLYKCLTLLAGTLICTTVSAQAIQPLTLAGEYTIPTGTLFKQVPFGGISGLYFDDSQQLYYAISDARNTPKEGEARFYTLTMDLQRQGIKQITITGMQPLNDSQSKPWPKGSVDAEGIAPTANGQGLYWTSELGSALRITDFNGKPLADLDNVIPSYYNTSGITDKTATVGLRAGLSFEGVSLTPNHTTLFLAAESALKQDGGIATPIQSSPARLLKYSVNQQDNSLKLTGEYIYNIDPTPLVSEFGVNDNGVADILALDDQRLLVIERAGRNASQGYNDWDFNIRVYLANLSHSTNISDHKQLTDIREPNTFQPLTKRLLIDFSDYTDKPDNVEAITFGPIIDNHKTLIFASDNNFQPYQANKFYLFIDEQDVLK